MLEIAVFVVVCIYLQIIINRDKRDRKRHEQIGKALDKEEKKGGPKRKNLEVSASNTLKFVTSTTTAFPPKPQKSFNEFNL